MTREEAFDVHFTKKNPFEFFYLTKAQQKTTRDERFILRF